MVRDVQRLAPGRFIGTVVFELAVRLLRRHRCMTTTNSVYLSDINLYTMLTDDTDGMRGEYNLYRVRNYVPSIVGRTQLTWGPCK
jgi:hypothetical protein